MKKLLLMLLVSSGIYAQENVYNVQQYCIDEYPFAKGECDTKGNEYSFVFMNRVKKEVVLFLADNKLKYTIIKNEPYSADRNFTIYTLKDKDGEVQMKINEQENKIEFLHPDRRIYLKVGRTTKLE